MQRPGSRLFCSPLDLTCFTACEHLAQLELAVALGEGTRPTFENAYADLIRRKGEEHERAFLESLRAAGRAVTHVGLGEGRDFEGAARATVEAIRAGVPYIYQAVLLAERWRGVADFLERVERPSGLGPWSYEVLDTPTTASPACPPASSTTWNSAII